jgi:cell fate (sporulation/competence/biofilm development) regulator YlbF (YheA/YmcA/DUF963 family)
MEMGGLLGQIGRHNRAQIAADFQAVRQLQELLDTAQRSGGRYDHAALSAAIDNVFRQLGAMAEFVRAVEAASSLLATARHNRKDP